MNIIRPPIIGIKPRSINQPLLPISWNLLTPKGKEKTNIVIPIITDNILLGKDGKLNQFLGTLNYAAPEIFLHRPYNGIKVDIFSLGVVLINLVTCKIGFVQANRKDKYYKYIIVKKYKQYCGK